MTLSLFRRILVAAVVLPLAVRAAPAEPDWEKPTAERRWKIRLDAARDWLQPSSSRSAGPWSDSFPFRHAYPYTVTRRA